MGVISKCSLFLAQCLKQGMKFVVSRTNLISSSLHQWDYKLNSKPISTARGTRSGQDEAFLLYRELRLQSLHRLNSAFSVSTCYRSDISVLGGEIPFLCRGKVKSLVFPLSAQTTVVALFLSNLRMFFFFLSSLFFYNLDKK